jgi:putative PEP-CTERM system histidine kinase
MSPATALAITAALLAVALSVAVVVRRRSLAAWLFSLGMLMLGIEAWCGGMAAGATRSHELVRWHTTKLIAEAFLPFPWIFFSLTYSRGDYLRHAKRWRLPLAAALVIPAALALAGRNSLVIGLIPGDTHGWIRYGLPALALVAAVLLSNILTLTNLERTLRAAVGTSRWKIKFGMLGFGLIFGTKIYTNSQSLLYSGFDTGLIVWETTAVIVGCLLLSVALLRQGFSEIHIYPSRAVIQRSVTIILSGGYLLVVGILARLAEPWGGWGNFHFQALVILAGCTVFAACLLSDRIRQRIRTFISRNFSRPHYDSHELWRSVTRRLCSVTGAPACCTESVKIIAETFQVLSVSIWLHDDRLGCLVRKASSGELPAASAAGDCAAIAGPRVLEGLLNCQGPFDLEESCPEWAENLKSCSTSHFKKGGGIWCLPLVAGSQALGAITLADRVNGVPYSTEELDLLVCIADQMAFGLANFKLTEELLQRREMEAFQHMSTFFVHDLKNTASSLTLMLRNFPAHYDDPAFREDALRGIANTVARINSIIERLGSLRGQASQKPIPTDLVEVARSAVEANTLPPEIELVTGFEPVPLVNADPQQLESVVTNLILNAVDAILPGRGRISVATSVQDGQVVLRVSDNGSGMTPEFIAQSLFRPFCTTKKKGLGIGMFQSRMMVGAHGGHLQVESQPGTGTTFRILLPSYPSNE